MAFSPVISFVSQDKSGRVIIIRDTTGTGSDGYSPTGLPREFVLSQRFTFSRLDSDEIFELSFEGYDHTYGKDIRVDSSLFSENPDAAAYIFKDGVIDINMYNEVAGRTGVTIAAGTNFVYGGLFTSVKDKDAIIVNGTIYQIDRIDNGDTVLYINGTFSEDATEFTAAYRANTKALLRSVAFNRIALAYKNILTQNTDQQCMYRVNLTDALGFYEASILFHEDQDYVTAQDLILSAGKLVANLSRSC